MTTRTDIEQLHGDIVRVLRSFEPQSDETADVRFATRTPRPTSRDTRTGHLTSSGVILTPDGRYVLLTLHRKLVLWLQTGGHCEQGETLSAAARREAMEESGLSELSILKAPVDIDIHQVPCGDRSLLHYDVRFAAVYCGPLDAKRNSDESRQLEWFPTAEMSAGIPPGTRRGIQAARRSLAS